MFEGDVPLVNGAPWPYFKAEPRRYRFRLLNGSNHRFYDLSFGGAPIYVIGADDNYLDKPMEVDSVSITPGEPADIIVDFSGLAGQNITMENDASSEGVDLPEIMQFQVVLPLKGKDKTCDPTKPGKGVCARPFPMVRLSDGHWKVAPGVKIDKVRQIVLDENFNPPTNIEESLNNTKWDGTLSPSIKADFPDGISEVPRVGSTELWEILNIFDQGNEPQSHPIHTHLTKFQILNRQYIKVIANGGYLAAGDAAFGTGPAPLLSGCSLHQFCPEYGPPLPYNTPNADGAVGGNPALSPFLLGDPIPPDPGESGWKDTAVAFGGEVLRILVRWTPSDIPVKANKTYAGRNLFPFDPTKGTYIRHCYIIDHEDNEMMRPYKVSK